MAVKFQDYYETLGVARSATAEEIKQAFRKLARRHHPDVAKDKTAGEARFKEINEAYEVLGDAEKRRRYDELGEHWQEGMPGEPSPHRRGRHRPPPGPPDFEFSGTGFSDFFESFFGGGHGGFGGAPPPHRPRHTGEPDFAQPERDVEADLLVSLEEALHGSHRRVTLKRTDHTGMGTRTDSYNVRIPPGVHEGQRIRLAGQGEPGVRGAEAGDLYLRVRLERHPDFTVQGSDLYCELPLAPWEAVLGTQVKLPTLDGSTTLRIPPGTVADSLLRLRGLGLPKANQQRGDLYATARIKTPVTTSPQERALWEQLAKTSPFKPRSEP
jgi:curved DNA-binding protein